MYSDQEEKLREAAYEHGVDTANAGMNDCPFKLGTIFYDDWFDGYSIVKDKEKEE